MPKVNLVQGKTPAEIVEKGLKALGSLKTLLPPKANILIAIDLPIPEHNPVSVNPDTLISVINHLNKEDITKISVIPATNPNINPLHALELLGIDTVLHQKGVEILTADITDILTILDQYNYFIVIAQIRTHPIWNITTCSPLLSLLHPSSREKSKDPQKSEGIVKTSLEGCGKILFRKVPQLIINDGFYVLEGNGSNIGLTSSGKRAEIMVIADDFYAGEYYTYQLFGLKPEEQRYIQFLQTQSSISHDLAKIELLESSRLENPILIKFPETQWQKIKIPGLELRIGQIDEDTQFALLELLYYLETMFFKDGKNLGQWYIMAGNMPPNVPKIGKIVLFGDAAITSTNDFEFRTKVVMKKALSPQELQKEISLQDGILRDKIDKQKNQFDASMSQIEAKEDLFEKEELKIAMEKDIEIKTYKIKHQQKLKQLKLTFKQEILRYENLVPKITLNKDILEVTGNPPQPIDTLFKLTHFWNLGQIPLLALFVDAMRTYYLFTEFDKKQTIQEWKRREQTLKLKLKEQNSPLLVERKTQIQKIGVEEKGKLTEAKNEFKQLMQKTKEIYKKRETDFKTRKTAHDRTIKQNQQATKAQAKTHAIERTEAKQISTPTASPENSPPKDPSSTASITENSKKEEV